MVRKAEDKCELIMGEIVRLTNLSDSEKLDLAAAESRAKFLENYFPNKISLVHGQMNAE